MEKPAIASDDDELLDTHQVAQESGLSESFYEKARCSGRGPRFIRMSSRVIRYRRGDFKEWLKSFPVMRTTRVAS